MDLLLQWHCSKEHQTVLELCPQHADCLPRTEGSELVLELNRHLQQRTQEAEGGRAHETMTYEEQ